MNGPVSASSVPRSTADAAPALRRSRLDWLDAFRGAAVLVMIETHVVNTFLDTDLWRAHWFSLLNYANGLVAPSFLFIAGFVVGLERRVAPDRPVHYTRRAKRLAVIGSIGLAMHFPFSHAWNARWAEIWQAGVPVDVLLCLALALGGLLGVTWLTESFGSREAAPRRTVIWWLGVAAIAGAVVLGAPLLAQWTTGPALIRSFINFSTGSLFPLLPWAGFVLLGALAGAWPQRPVAERMTAVLAIFAVGWVSKEAVFSPSSPAFFLGRAACVLGLALVAEAWEGRRFPRIVRFAGEHSLTLYLAHLIFIRMLVGFGAPEKTWNWPATIVGIVVVGAVSLGVTRLVQSVVKSRFGQWFQKRPVSTGIPVAKTHEA